MPQSRSKRKGKKHAGRGRAHRLAGLPFSAIKYLPFTDVERRDIALDVELNFRAVRVVRMKAARVDTAPAPL